MTVRFILYAILAIIFQVGLGMLTGMGQGSTGLLVFVVLVELDPNFSFAYLVQYNDKGDKNE